MSNERIPVWQSFRQRWEDRIRRVLTPLTPSAETTALTPTPGDSDQTLRDKLVGALVVASEVDANTSAPIQTNTITTLRSFSPNYNLPDGQQITVGGYYTNGDGGGGRYHYDASDTTSVDNGGSVIVSAAGKRFIADESAEVNPAQWGARGLKYAGLSLTQDTVDQSMDVASTARFNWTNQNWSGFAVAGGKMVLTETGATGPNQCYLSGIFPSATSVSGSTALIAGRAYTVRLKVRLASGTAHTLWVGQSRSPSVIGFTIPGSKINSTEREFRGTWVAPADGNLYVGLFSNGDASGASYELDDVQVCMGSEDFGTEVSSITRVGTTATVTTATAHGLSNGAAIISGVIGADAALYNGGQTITVTGTTTFTYVMTGTPAAVAVLGFARVLPDDTDALKRMFEHSAGKHVVFLPSRSYHATDALTVLNGTQLDLSNGRIAFHLRGNKRGLCSIFPDITVQNGEVNVLFGTGATSPDGDDPTVHCPLSLTSSTSIGQEDFMVLRNLSLGGQSDRTNSQGVYALMIFAPRSCVVENVNVLPGSTFSRGFHAHWQKVNLGTAGVYPPRNITVRNYRVSALTNPTFYTTGLYFSNASNVDVENVRVLGANNALYVVGGDILDGYDASGVLGHGRAPIRFSNIHATGLTDLGIIIDGKSIANDISYATGTTAVDSFTITSVTNGYGFAATQLYKAGDRIFGPGIPYGTVVQAVTSSTIIMSRRATAAGTGVVLNRIKDVVAVVEDSLFRGTQALTGLNDGFSGGDNGDVTFNRVKFQNFRYGINMKGPSAGAPYASARNVRFNECEVSASYFDGVTIRGVNRVTLSRCRIFSNSQAATNTYHGIKVEGSLGGYLPDIDGLIIDECVFGQLGVVETQKWATEFTYTTRTRGIELTRNQVLANGSTGECFQWTVAGQNSGHDMMVAVRDNITHPTLNMSDFYSGLLYFTVAHNASTRRRTLTSRVSLASLPVYGTWYSGDVIETSLPTTQGSRTSVIVRTTGTGGSDPGVTATTTAGSPWILVSDGKLVAPGIVCSVFGGHNGGIVTEVDGNWVKLSSNAGTSVSGVNLSLTAFAFLDRTYLQYSTTGALTIGVGGTGVTRLRFGRASAMVGGVIAVADAYVTANTRIILSVYTPGGTRGFLSTGTRIASTSFTITSTSVLDTSVVDWVAFEP
jgi:hypothetical protein